MPEGKDHRPDGYTIVKHEGKSRPLAFEVELHAKASERYSSAIRWYDLMKPIQRVFWLVGNEYVIDQFKKGAAEARVRTNGLHLFISLEEYFKSGWDSICVTECAEKVGSLREIFGHYTGQENGEHLGNRGYKPDFSIFTDHRKYLSLSKASPEIFIPSVF